MLSRTKENEHAISSWPEGYFPELCTCYHQLCKKDQGWHEQCVPSMHILITAYLQGTHHLALFKIPPPQQFTMPVVWRGVRAPTICV